jgi:NADP-dependent aldehyde dehydrogenase
MASGQFCTSPGLTILFASNEAEQFIAGVKAKLEGTTPPTLLSSGVARNLAASVKTLQAAGAELVTGGLPLTGNRFANTLLRVSGEKFLSSPEKLQTEAFGNASLAVVVRDAGEAAAVINHLEGNLTGGIYSDAGGSDDALYGKLAPLLRTRVGRLLNDKMPTGVAVSPAMNHGGPFPATGHPGFTAVGIPASLRRFAALHCYDNVRPARLPDALQNKNPNGIMWRLVDGNWSQGDVTA